MCRYPISVTKILGAIGSETELRRAFSLTHQPVCRLGVRGVAVQTHTGSGSSACPCGGPGLGLPRAGRDTRRGSSVRDSGPGLQGAHGAAGSRTQTVTVTPQVTASPSLGGARKPCSCPAMILEETGVGVRLRSGEQAGKLGTRTAPPQGPPAVTRVVCRRVSSLQVWISPEHPMLCCVVMLSEDAWVPSSPSCFSFFPSFLWLPWFGKVPG